MKKSGVINEGGHAMKRILFIAAALLGAAFVSCQKEINQENSEPRIGSQTYTLTLSASKVIATKALALDETGNSINATWGADDKVAVYAVGSSTPLGTLELDAADAGTAEVKLKGNITISGIKSGDKLNLMFVGQNPNTKAWTYENQKGTLDDLQKNYDYATAQIEVTNVDSSNKVLTATDANFVNQQAIVKFTLKDGDNALSVSSLRISAKSGKLVSGYESVGGAFSAKYGDIVVTPDDEASVFYVALRNNSTSSDEYTLTATKAGTTYFFSKSDITFANGSYRHITVKMNSTTAVYTVAGTPASIFGSEWEASNADNDMILQGDGTYRKSYTLDGTNSGEIKVSLKVVVGHAWTISYPSSNYEYTIPANSKGTFVVGYEPDKANNVYAFISSDNSYTVVGSVKDDATDGSIFGTPWDPTKTANDMALQDDGTYLKTYAVDGTEGTISYKIAKDHAWSANTLPSNTAGDNFEYTIPCAGTLMISLNPSTNSVKAWMEELTYTLVYSKDEWNTTAHPMVMQADGSYKCTITDVPKGYLEYKVLKQENEWIGDPNNNGKNFQYTVPAAGDLIFTYNPQNGTVKVDIRISNTTPDALRLALSSATSGDIIEMKAGTYVESNENYIAFSGKEVTIRAAEGAEVIIQPQVPITVSEGGKAEFVGVIFDASHLLDKATWYEHLIYASDANANNRLVLESCEIKKFTLNKSAIYCDSSNKFASVTINNCYFHDINKSCFFSEGESVGVFTMTNSTIANITTDTGSYYAGVFDPRGTSVALTVDHCTFYNCAVMNTDYGVVTVRGASTKGITVSNCIFMMPDVYVQRAIYIVDGATPGQIKNCIVYNYTASTNGIRKGGATQENCSFVDPLFKAAASNDFTLTTGSPALTASVGSAPIGDPRWYQ